MLLIQLEKKSTMYKKYLMCSFFRHANISVNIFRSVSESLSNSSDPNFMVVLLADMELQRLPLEALALLRENRNISGFSRDFSLQMFHNRFSAEAGDETTEEGKDKKAKGEKAGGGGAGKNTKTQKESKRPQVST